jgi:hypothetical protein
MFKTVVLVGNVRQCVWVKISGRSSFTQRKSMPATRGIGIKPSKESYDDMNIAVIHRIYQRNEIFSTS